MHIDDMISCTLAICSLACSSWIWVQSNHLLYYMLCISYIFCLFYMCLLFVCECVYVFFLTLHLSVNFNLIFSISSYTIPSVFVSFCKCYWECAIHSSNQNPIIAYFCTCSFPHQNHYFFETPYRSLFYTLFPGKSNGIIFYSWLYTYACSVYFRVISSVNRITRRTYIHIICVYAFILFGANIMNCMWESVSAWARIWCSMLNIIFQLECRLLLEERAHCVYKRFIFYNNTTPTQFSSFCCSYSRRRRRLRRRCCRSYCGKLDNHFLIFRERQRAILYAILWMLL